MKRVCEDVQHQVCAAPDRPFMVAKRRGDTVIAIMPTLWNLVPGVGPTAAQGGVVTLLTLCRPSPAYSHAYLGRLSENLGTRIARCVSAAKERHHSS